MFVHAGIFHLLGNMIFLFLFGSCVEDIIGRLRFAVFYLVGGLLAEFVYIAMLPDHFTSVHPMGGASGAISACMGMYLLLRAGADIEFKYFFWFFFVYVRAGEFEIPAWVAITFWFLKDLFWAVLGMVLHERGGGVAFGAHVGGFLGGLALVSLYKWIGQPREESSAKPALILDPATILVPPAPQYQPAETTGETPTIYLYEAGEQTGPFTLSQIQAMLQRGAVSHDAFYWCEGMADWQSVVELASHPME
jgi:membrane associated rhomboid family serine protease